MRSSLRGKFNFLFLKNGETLEWRAIKISLAFFWIMMMRQVLSSYGITGQYHGICNWFPCNVLAAEWVKNVVQLLCWAVAILYVLEVRMTITCFALAFLSTVIFTFEESHGVFIRSSTYSAIFFAQVFAYAFAKNKPFSRIHFSKQIIAATYTLSGLSKLYYSGFTWFAGGKYLLLQVKKGAYYKFFDTGHEAILHEKDNYIRFFIENPTLFNLLLLGALLLELTCGLLLFSRKLSYVYGILLVCMHIGIQMVMDIIIAPIAFPMIILLLNPLYLFLLPFAFLRKKIPDLLRPKPGAS
jgi:hypothetical protein